MQAGVEKEVLKGVSRSFYLSLRLLPPAMRRPASIAYLLARLSDTIADSAEIAAADRLEMLENFGSQVAEKGAIVEWPERLIAATPDDREKELLRGHRAIMESLASLGEEERGLIREVVAIIVSGQALDLERFGAAGAGNIISLSNDEELNDYTWRVAGCVGAFWTKLGYATLGGEFSQSDESELLLHAREYGRGLQLVNILRDLPKDFEGRPMLSACCGSGRYLCVDEEIFNLENHCGGESPAWLPLFGTASLTAAEESRADCRR